MTTKSVVLGLSGGLDSSTLLSFLLSEGFEVHACSFQYGSKHGKWEQEAAKKVIAFYQNLNYPLHHHIINLTEAFKDFDSALLLTGEAIPEGHYNDETMSRTVVPGRNMIFSSIMAGL